MVHTSRRRLLAVGGIAAFAGCLSSDDDDESSDPVPEATGDSLLSMLPASVEDKSLFFAQYGTVSEERSPVRHLFVGQSLVSGFGLEPEQIDRAGTVGYADATIDDPEEIRFGRIFQGTFDADDIELEEQFEEEFEEDGEIYKEDGLVILSNKETEDGMEPWPALIDAIAETQAGDRDNALTVEAVETVFDEISDAEQKQLFPEPSLDGLLTAAEQEDAIAAYAMGYSHAGDRTVSGAHVGALDDGTSVDESVVEAEIDRQFEGTVAVDTEVDDGVVIGEFTHKVPPRPDRQASPDARIRLEYDSEQDAAIIEHSVGEAVPTDELHVFIDGEREAVDWGTDKFESGDTTTLPVSPVDAVRIEWRDPTDEETFDVFDETVIHGRNAFQPEYDPDRDAVVISYDGPPIERTERLELRHQPDDAQQRETIESVTDRTSRLEAGDELLVDAVDFEDRLRLYATYESDRGVIQESLARITVRPPGRFQYSDKEQELSYRGEKPVPAENYRITIDGEPAPTQFTAEYDTLEAEAAVSVDADVGEVIVVEWVGGDESYPILERIIRPAVQFELYRDGDTYRLEYTEGETWPAAEFEIRDPHESIDTQFSDQHDTIEPGDSVTLDYEPDSRLTIMYLGGAEPAFVDRVAFRRSIDFTLAHTDDETVLTYDAPGEWPATAFEVTVDGDTIGQPFSAAHDTVTEGNSVTIDADLATEVAVEVDADGHEQEVFSAPVQPNITFEPEYDDGELVLEYEADEPVPAELLTIDRMATRRDEETADPWGERGTVEDGDTVRIDVTEDEHLSVLLGEHRVEQIPVMAYVPRDE